MNKLFLSSILISTILLSSCGGSPSTFIATWTNEDGSVLEVDKEVKDGTTPHYDGTTPTKAGDAQYAYTFSGWTPEVGPIHADMTYKATFEQHTNTFTVVFNNYDGTQLDKQENIPYGTTITYTKANPTREGPYIFAGWDKPFEPITANTIYTATYNEITTKYTVTWKNYDGSTLETDNDVSYNSNPEYNGETPTRPGYFVFVGWSPELKKVTEDITYTAQFIDVEHDIPGVIPTLSADKKTLTYGMYPQTHVTDTDLITELEKISPISTGWYLYNYRFYVKETAKVFNNESYTFNNGTEIVNGTDYWYSCEAITWTVLSNTGNNYYVVSNLLLDSTNYYLNYQPRTSSTIYPNNYKESILRNKLNLFYNTAFFLNSVNINTLTVDNSASTTEANPNVYACSNTEDKVTVLSYQEANTLTNKITKTSEYARANGAWASKEKNYLHNGAYWTRSPSSVYDYAASVVNGGGYLSSYPVDETCYCIRPVINVRIMEN